MFDSYRNKKDLPITQEESKYKSKKESSTSHSSAKSKHKHEYKPCKLRYSETYCIPDKGPKTYTFTNTADYCTICGRISNWKMHLFEEEMKKFDLENPDAPIFEVSGDLREKFVKI